MDSFLEKLLFSKINMLTFISYLGANVLSIKVTDDNVATLQRGRSAKWS